MKLVSISLWLELTTTDVLGTDEFAADLNKGPQLARALIKIMNENLASPHNDWLYSMYKHSHPTLVERLSRLNEYEQKTGHATQGVVEEKKEL
jgi:STE24 endopeptidase